MSPSSTAARALTLAPEPFLSGCRDELEQARAEVARLKALPAAPRDTEPTLALYDRAMSLLGNVSARASVCRSAHPDEAMRDAAEKVEQEAEALATELSLDRGVYDALAGLDAGKVDASTRYYLSKVLRDFRRAGVDRDAATRERVRALRDELVRIGQQFDKNIKDDVRSLSLDPAEMDGLPEDYGRAHPPGPDGKVTVTTDNTDYIPFVTYARSARAREALWRLYRRRAHPANLDVLGQLLERRHELARLLGYPSWAAYATEDKMIGSAQAAADFIARISDAAAARCRRDYEQLLARKRQDTPDAERVDAWDNAYYQERVKAEQYGFDAQTIRPYLEYRRVKQGVLDVTSRLFNIQYRHVPDAVVWHPDVEAHDVLDGERVLGRIYLDMHPREGKYKHYAQFTLVTGVAGQRLPEGVLLCNFPRPGTGPDAAPALLEHSDVETFFHEFGHLLHHVLGGHTRWAGISGVATEWDFVEAPSQMLEEWVWDAGVLGSFARHVETGEPIPADLVRRAKTASDYGRGLGVRQQMFYAALSLELYSREPAGLDTTRLAAELQERYTPFHHVEDTYVQASFGHLDGYSAIYYTYMWSLVIAKDLFSVFKAQGLLDAGAAARYRRAVLEPGGGKPAAELVQDFLGRPYSFDAYQQWLDAG